MKRLFIVLLYTGVVLYGMESDQPPLFIAIKKGDVDKVECLIRDGADLTQLFFDEEAEQIVPPLTCAVVHNNRQIALLLLKAGVDPNVFDDCGRSALHYAAMLEFPSQMINLLQDNGADPHIKGDESDMTPYEWLKCRGY